MRHIIDFTKCSLLLSRLVAYFRSIRTTFMKSVVTMKAWTFGVSKFFDTFQFLSQFETLINFSLLLGGENLEMSFRVSNLIIVILT